MRKVESQVPETIIKIKIFMNLNKVKRQNLKNQIQKFQFRVMKKIHLKDPLLPPEINLI